VAVAELTGQSVATAMNMADRVHAASRPLNIETMHVIIAKTHPHARTVLYYVNSSLARLRETGAYDSIVAKHLELFWNTLGQTPPPAAGQPAPSASDRKPVVPPEQGSELANRDSGRGKPARP
jgi:hypothetical protein